MKIKLVAASDEHIQLYPMIKPKVRNRLSDMGIEFVDKGQDMILYHTYRAPKELRDSTLNSGCPVMILERIASARIYSRKYISYPNVVGVLKSTIFRDLILDNSEFNVTNNYPECDFKNNYHSRVIAESLGRNYKYTNPPDLIPEESFKKVELWYNFASYQMMDLYIHEKDVLNRKRPYDIGFMGTTKYSASSELITAHRTKCMDTINSLKNVNNEIFPHRVKGKENYLNNILNSKIGISPWGLGEKCYRDFEVIYGGGLLVKPDTSFVLDWIDTYDPKNKYYIPCATDFSDLQEIVDKVKSSWDSYLEFRESARNRLIDRCWKPKHIAKHIHDVFHRCSERIQS